MGRPTNPIRKLRSVIKINKQGARNLLVLADTVVARMTGNANFTTPVPALTTLTSAATDAKKAFTFQSQKRNRGSKEETLDFQNKVQVLRNVLLAIQGYVINTALIAANGDALLYGTIVASSGYGVIPPNKRQSRQQLPTFIRQTNNKLHPGTEGRINWKRPIGNIKGARINGYNIYHMVGGNWVIMQTVTKTNAIIPVAPGASVDIKIVPFNSRGEGQAQFMTVKGLS